jgi:hypothetical protein
VAEGTIVRVITRLDETCREVRDAARVIGDADLFKKMEDAQVKIKRDSECRYLCMQTKANMAQLCLRRVCTFNEMNQCDDCNGILECFSADT